MVLTIVCMCGKLCHPATDRMSTDTGAVAIGKQWKANAPNTDEHEVKKPQICQEEADVFLYNCSCFSQTVLKKHIKHERANHSGSVHLSVAIGIFNLEI